MEQTAPRPYAFVLMPFDSSFRDIYEVGIKQACLDAGAYCERVDEQIFTEGILERIYNQVAKADVVIADMTGQNPNVFYEVGYAHALGKRTILLTQESGDIPFDLMHFPHVVYHGRIADLRSQLRARVKWCIDNPTNGGHESGLLPRFFIDGGSLDNGHRITRPQIYVTDSRHREYRSAIQIHLALDLQNPHPSILPGVALKLALITSRHLKLANPSSNTHPIRLPDGTFIHHLPPLPDMFPEGWLSIPATLEVCSDPSQLFGTDEMMMLRVYSPVGHHDISFGVHIVDEVLEEHY